MLRFVLTLALGLVLVTAQLLTVHTVVGQAQTAFGQTAAQTSAIEPGVNSESCTPFDPLQPCGHVHNDSMGQPQIQLMAAFFVVVRILCFDVLCVSNVRPLVATETLSTLPVWLATQRLLI